MPYQEPAQPVNRYLRSNERNEAVYAAIVAYAAAHYGATPTLAELMPVVGLRSTSTVAYHVQMLLGQGRLQVLDGKLIVAGSRWLPPEGDA